MFARQALAAFLGLVLCSPSLQAPNERFLLPNERFLLPNRWFAGV